MSEHGVSVPVIPKPAGDARPTEATRRDAERLTLGRNSDGSYAIPCVTWVTRDDGSYPAVAFEVDGKPKLVRIFDRYESKQAWALRDLLLERIHRAMAS